jgi:peptidoglycan hydrolase-like protein with peptidoglycan-binding domain
MDLKSLIAKMDAIEQLDERWQDRNKLNLDTIQKAVGNEQDPQTRYATLAKLATDNGLPGLYDPVQGGYIDNKGGAHMTAPSDIDVQLASLGLLPDKASTSTMLGRLNPFSDSSSDRDARLQSTSQDYNKQRAAGLAHDAAIDKVQELMDKLAAAKAAHPAGGTAAATPATSTTPANPTAQAGKSFTTADGHTVSISGDKMIVKDKEGKTAEIPLSSLDPANQEQLKQKLKENRSISEELVESFGYTTESEATLAQQAAVGAGTYAGVKGIGKVLGKAVPGVGAAFGAADAYNRYKSGDYFGAGLAGLSGALSLVPGVGWIPALAIDAFNFGRDMTAGPKASAQAAEKHPQPGGLIAKLQKMIGTDADGIWGPKSTEALKQWQAQKGITADGIPGPETFGAAGLQLAEGMVPRTTADLIKETQQRLAALENPDPLLFLLEDGRLIAVHPDNEIIEIDEGILGNLWQGGKDVLQGIKNFGRGTRAGYKAPDSARVAGLKGAAGKGAKVGKFVKQNPAAAAGIAGAGGLAAGLGAGYALGGDSDPSTVAGGGVGGGSGGGNQGGAAQEIKPSDEEIAAAKELQQAIADMKAVDPQSQDKEIQFTAKQAEAELAPYLKFLGSDQAGKAADIGKEAVAQADNALRLANSANATAKDLSAGVGKTLNK